MDELIDARVTRSAGAPSACSFSAIIAGFTALPQARTSWGSALLMNIDMSWRICLVLGPLAIYAATQSKVSLVPARRVS